MNTKERIRMNMKEKRQKMKMWNEFGVVIPDTRNVKLC